MHIGDSLGDLYRRATGEDPRDPKTEQERPRFGLDQAKRGGWGPWHGAARIGVHGHSYQATKMLTHSRRVTPHERRRAFALASGQNI